MIQEIVPLLPLQKTMLYKILSQPDSRVFSEQWRYKVTGLIDVVLMKKAWIDTMNSFDVLHGIFQWKDRKEPVFLIQKEVNTFIRIYNLKHIAEDQKQVQADLIARNEYLDTVDLEKMPVRAAIIFFDDRHCEWIVISNHILFDGWSNSLIMTDWIERYRAYCCGRIPNLVQQQLAYSDYVQYVCREQENQRHEKFWRRYLHGCGSSSVVKYRDKGAHRIVNICLTKSEIEQIDRFCRINNCTFSTVLYTVWALLLYTEKSGHSVIIGVTVSGRNFTTKPGIDRLPGLLAKTLPLRVNLGNNPLLREVLNQIRVDLIEIEEHMHVDPMIWLDILPDIQDCFREGLTIQNYPVQQYGSDSEFDCVIEFYHSNFYSDMDFAVSVKTFHSPISLQIVYCSERYSLSDVYQRMEIYRRILRQLTEAEGDFSNIRSLN